MENASKAFIIASGTLIALVIMSVLVYFMNNLSEFPRELDNEEYAEQLKAFNQEYEAYNKKIMYGADLISVLNKAKSNNEKYISGKGLDGGTYSQEYVVNVSFKLKSDSPLTDNVIVSYMKINNEYSADGSSIKRTTTTESNYTSGTGVTTEKLLNVFNNYSSNYVNDVLGSNVINSSTQLITKQYVSNVFTGGTVYNLCQFSGGKPTANLNGTVNSLLKCSDAITRTKKNSSTDNYDKMMACPENGNKNGWTKVEWRTALYDLKSRKFKCVGTKYDSNIGRITELSFEEF